MGCGIIPPYRSAGSLARLSTLLKGYGLGQDCNSSRMHVKPVRHTIHYRRRTTLPMAAVVREAFKMRILSGQVVYRRLPVSLQISR